MNTFLKNHLNKVKSSPTFHLGLFYTIISIGADAEISLVHSF